MGRTLILAGNWKMHKGPEETGQFLKDLQHAIDQNPASKRAITGGKLQVLFFPPFVSLASAEAVRTHLLPEASWDFGAQNCHWESTGAFTGEVSPDMLIEAGCHYVIIGHSERRHVFGEPDTFMEKKVSATMQQPLTPILCVGETLEEREAGQTFEVVDRQLLSAICTLSAEQVGEKLIVAYEPVWAIGTGKTASNSDAQEVCQHIRESLGKQFDSETAAKVPILYGGSVKPSNARGLMAQEDIDGALIGGASLKVESFVGIMDACLEDL